MWTGNDVMTVSPLDGVVGQSSTRILNSERQSPTSYLQLIITFGLSLTVSKLLAFVCGPERSHAGFSARWRGRSKSNANSERQSTTSICD